eukprot:Skav216227  [mRNA]  locus=scaffold238:390745:391581:+ [translate_table: standard]
MAAMWTLLPMLLCISTVSGAEDVCATCAPSPPAQSAALLQSSVQRHAKTAGGPHVFSPAQLFGPGPMGRHASHMGRMGPRMGPRMSQPHYDFALRHAREKQRRAKSTQESLYESSYGGAELTPCQEPSSWTPEKDIYGWCDTWNMAVQPDEASCNGDGCRYSWGYCYCEIASQQSRVRRMSVLLVPLLLLPSQQLCCKALFNAMPRQLEDPMSSAQYSCSGQAQWVVMLRTWDEWDPVWALACPSHTTTLLYAMPERSRDVLRAPRRACMKVHMVVRS